MQDGVREEDDKFTKVERALIGMLEIETLVLVISSRVSLRWYNIVVTYYVYQCFSARHVIVTCGPSVTWCLCVCVHM